ncbi:MFS transporter [Kribbella italica]|uniref:MFS family permease n=1 Tax=Kribbella italica TaxID=1540520 RepID=A0A7W9J2P8_9ACTN|nr:MFS transporter [Kribbella italica]MBB5834025.1 MFS family permease [Kribbella italica]
MTPRLWLLFSARTVSVLGNAFGPIAIAFGVLALPGATPGVLATVLAAQTVPQLALVLLGGVIGDRFPRYRVLVVAELMAAAGYAALAAMLLTGWAPIGMLTGAAFVTGVASALLLPSLTGVMAEVVGEGDRQRANAQLKLGTNCARIAGLFAAGATVALLGPGVALAVDAATYVVAAILLGALKLPVTVRTERRDVLTELRTGWREFSRRQWLWATVCAAAFINAASTAGFGVLGPVLLRDRPGGSVLWSIVLVGYAAGMLAGVFVVLRIRPRRPLVVATAMTPLLALPLIALGLELPVPVVAAAAFCSGVAMDVFGVLWETAVQNGIPAELLSRVGAYEYLAALSLKPVGSIAAGVLATGLGAAPALLLFGGVVVLAGTAAALVPGVRHLESTQEAGARS